MPYSTSVPPWWPRDDRFPRSPQDLASELRQAIDRLSLIDHFLRSAESHEAIPSPTPLLNLQFLRRALADTIGHLLLAEEVAHTLRRYEEPRP